ncbi:MAG TPA: KpsF/GutQ family sugar-phosphate isomerase [Gemmatimonadales bacterium]|jgi:arabinose-5-phosphate isomerase
MIDALAVARHTLRLEGEAILAAADRVDGALSGAVELLADSTGRVIVSGIGKSGVIAQKIAATLTSTGTAASYVHPIESLHGDLGLVDRHSVAILLSKSGETEELFGLLGALVRLAVPVIAITGARESTLGRAARFVLDASVAEEACPHDLAPTTSTAVALAWGDALAMALLDRKGFSRADFGALHPGGRIGRRLFLRVRDVMVASTATLPPIASMQEVIVALAHGRGLVMLADGGDLVGVITAGDLTRIAGGSAPYLDRPAHDIMTRTPRIVRADDLATAALGELERAGIMAAPVLDQGGAIAGVVHLHDLLRSGAA